MPYPPPQPFDVRFLGGLNTKLPENLLPPGALSVCQNTAMRKPGMVEKRWGSSLLPKPPQSNCNWDEAFGVGIPGSTLLGNELLVGGPVGSLGVQQHGFSPATNGWIPKGSVQPLAVTEKVAYSGAADCQATDLALNFNTPIAGGCYGCYVYQTPTGVSFTVVDDKSGQTVMSNQAIAPGFSNPRVVSIGPYFVLFATTGQILYAWIIDPAQHTATQYGVAFGTGVTRYDARGVTNAPANVGHGGQYIAVAMRNGANLFLLGFDPWAPATFGLQAITSTAVVSLGIGIFSANIAVIFNDNNTTVKVAWFDLSITPGSVETLDTAVGYPPWGKLTIGPTAQGFTAFWETLATQDGSGDFVTLPAIRTASGTVASGTACTATCIKRNVSLAGDLFTLGGVTYLPTVYQGAYLASGTNAYTQMQSLQPTYLLLQVSSSFVSSGDMSPKFVTTASAVEVARFAQSNAGGPTLNQKCPQVSTDLNGNVVWGCGLGTQQTGAFNGAYQQVRAVARAVCTPQVQPFSKTLGQNLHMTGGFLSAYDGVRFTEHNFHLVPEAPTVDACNIACCRVQMGNPSVGSVVSATGFIADSNNQDPVNLGPYPNSGLIFTAIKPGTSGDGIAVLISLTSSLVPTFITANGSSVVITPQTNGTVVTETDGGVISALAAYNLANPSLALVTAALAPGTAGGAGSLLSNWQANPSNPCTTAGGSNSAVNSSATTPANWTKDTETFQVVLNPVPNLGTVSILDAGVVVATDFASPGTVVGQDPVGGGAKISGTVSAAGTVAVTFAGSGGHHHTGGAITVSWSYASFAPEINDVYFPPDTMSPGALIRGAGWQIRPSSYVLITAQSISATAGAYLQGDGIQGGPCGYVWFSIDGIGTDPVAYPSGGVQCALLSNDTAAQCAQKFRQAINNGTLAAFVTASAVVQNVLPPTGGVSATSKVTVTAVLGLTWSAGAPLTYSEDFRLDCYTSPQSSGRPSGAWLACPSGKKIMPGGYFVVPTNYAVNNLSVMLIFWYAVSYNGGASYVGQAPAVVGQPSVANLMLPVLGSLGSPVGSTVQQIVQIQVLSTDTPAQVASKTFAVLGVFSGPTQAYPFLLAGPYGAVVQIALWNNATVAYLTPYNVSSSGILPDGLYEYAADWEWNDAKGQLHQSGVSQIVAVNIQGASPTFDPFGIRYNAPNSTLAQNPNGHGMLLFGSAVGGSSPFLITPSLWATQKPGVTLAIYRSLVSVQGARYRVTDAAQAFAPANPPANYQSTAVITNPDPTQPNAQAANPLTGTFLPVDIKTFIDTTPDSQVNANAVLYTNGGNYSYTPVPSCSFLHVHQGRIWALSAEDPSQAWISNVFTSESQLAVEFCLQNIEDIDPALGQCVAFSSCDDKLVELCQYGLFYVTGDGPSPAGVGGFNVPQRIMCDVGCIAPGSVFETFDGVRWQSPNGFYFCDRNLLCSYWGQPFEDLVQGMTCMKALVAPNGQTEFRLFMVGTPGQANPATDYCLTFNYVTNWWSQSLKQAANSAVIWYPPGQSPALVFVDGAANVSQETPGHYIDNGAPISRKMTTGRWGKQAGEQGFMRIPQLNVRGIFLSLPSPPINSMVKVLVGYDNEAPSRQAVWDPTQLLAAPVGPNPAPGDGVAAEFRLFVPPSPRGGNIETITFTIEDVVNPAQPDDPGIGFDMLSASIIPLGGLERMGPLRTTG